MKISTIVQLLLALFTFGNIGTAGAEDFNFTVPVQLRAMTANVIGGEVFCGVGATGNVPGEVPAIGRTSFTIPASGDFSGNVVVRFNATNQVNRTRYFCFVTLNLLNGRFSIGLPYTHDPSGEWGPDPGLAVSPKPGTSFIPRRDGDLPQ